MARGAPTSLQLALCGGALFLSAGCGESGAGAGGKAADAAPGGDALGAVDAGDSAPLDLQFIDPDHGPFSGGTEVLLRGTGFESGAVVRFGGRMVEPLDLEVIDSRRIRVRTPPGEPGLADVEVTLGDESASLEQAFRYEAIYVDPPSGSVAGGTFVTLTGLGTDFDETTTVTFDGLPVTSLDVVNDQVLTGLTPPGVAGAADVVVQTQAASYEAERGYTYLTTGDPFFGGMSGGPIDGTINVVVIDANTDNGIPGAYVVVGDPETSPHQGFTDSLGQITFSAPGLSGPVTTTAGAEGYETTSFTGYDAENLTIFLNRPPEPSTGPIPPGPQVGHIFGHVLFGDATSLGSPTWDLVPEPRTPTERKRLYVVTTAPSIFSTSFSPNQYIDYQGFDPDKVAWEFDVYARPSALAVVAVAGLYDPEKDPSGTGVAGFEPFAMGVTRGVLVGPGENVYGVDVVVNIPLDTAVKVDLDQPPALKTPGWDGPTFYNIRPFIDLGGEGAIPLSKPGLPLPPISEPAPNVYRFEDGEESILMPRMAPLSGSFADASYSFIIAAYSPGQSNPFSVRVARGIDDVTLPVEIGDFLGTPRPVDPEPGGLASEQAVEIASEPPATGDASFHLHILTDGTSGAPLMRVFSRGDIFRAGLPDLTYGGLPPFPAEQDVSWTFYRIQIPSFSFDEFTYRHLSARFWSAYAADAHTVQFP